MLNGDGNELILKKNYDTIKSTMVGVI